MSSRVLRFAPILLIAGLVLAAGTDRGPARSFAVRANQSAPTSAVLPSPPGGTPPATADLEDLGLEVPSGVTLALLGSGAFGRLPTGPTVLRLDRLPLAPGASTAEIRASGPHLLYVEAGNVVLTGVPGLAGTYGFGAEVPLPPAASYALRNDATEPASLLRLQLVPEGDTTPVGGTPVDSSAQVLLTATVPRLQQQPTSTLLLTRTTWDPGADTGWRAYPGPLGLVVESGTLLVSGPNRATFQLGADEGILAPAFVSHRVRNAGEETVTALVAAVIPGVDRGQARGPAATPTQPVDRPATAAAATIEALSSYQATAEMQLTSADAQAGTAVALAATATAQAATLATVGAEATVAGLAAVATTQMQSTQQADLEASAEARATDAAGAAAAAGAQATSAQATIVDLRSGQEIIEAEAATPRAAATAASATVAALATAAAQVAGTSAALAATSTAGAADMNATATIVAAQAEQTAGALSAEADSAQSTSVALAGTVETLATGSAATNAARALAEAAATAGAGAAAATLEAQRARETTLAATATADTREAEATVDSLGSAVASAQADRALLDATAAAEATSAAGAQATGAAQATAAGATSEAEAANAGATIAAMATEGSFAGANAAATASAQEATLRDVGATATAAAESAATTATDLRQQASGAEATNVAFAATATAQAAARAAGEATLASVEAQATVAQATAIALATRQAETASLASSAIDPVYVEEPIQVDPNGLLAGDPAAQEAARAELRRILAPYEDGCRAGVVLTFGHGSSVEVGTALARLVNELLTDEFPDLFEGAAFEDFVNFDPPVGQVDVRIYLFTGCEPAENEETPAPEPTAA